MYNHIKWQGGEKMTMCKSKMKKNQVNVVYTKRKHVSLMSTG